MATALIYDPHSAASIFEYSKGLIGKTLYEAAKEIDSSITLDDLKIDGKGGLGQLVEKFYYGYKPNSDPEADFAVAGVELKTTPLKETCKGLAIKERLVADMIDFCSIVNLTFEESPFYKKCLLMLILFYLHQAGVKNYNLKFLYSILWKIQGKDYQIIKHDYEVIVQKIKDGKAHELSEGDTLYLGACRKGQKGDPLRKQPFSTIGAPKRAFSLKTTYMRTVLDYIIASGESATTNTDIVVSSTSLVTEEELKHKSFEQVILDRLMEYKGKDYKQIAHSRGVKITTETKNKYHVATSNILCKGLANIENAEELRKSGVRIKTIRLEKDGKFKEAMSFDQINYKEVYETESFYDSAWYDIATTRRLFVIYRKEDVPEDATSQWKGEEDDRYVLDRAFFWTMPAKDLEVAEDFWNNIKQKVMDDVYYTDKSPYWKESDNRSFHVRTKAKDSRDLAVSPVSGRLVKKTAYWFNHAYVKSILLENYGDDWKREFPQSND